MKKTHCVISILTILFLLLTGCGAKDKDPLRICVDIEYVHRNDLLPPLQEWLDELAQHIKEAGGPDDIEFELILEQGTERETTLDRIRTEVMTGGGPDIFIIGCDKKISTHTQEALFPMPQKAMELSIFMPLDEYMEESTRFSEWDDMQPTVLAAGRNEEGQQIIPLTYTVPVSVFHQEEVQHTTSKEMTWADMIQSDDPAMNSAAVWTSWGSVWASVSGKESSPFNSDSERMPEYILGEIADYADEELLFSEEELTECIVTMQSLFEQYTKGAFNAAPAYYKEYLGYDFNRELGYVDSFGVYTDLRNGFTFQDACTFIPLYSEAGGVTAEISAYTAINRNTTRPEDSYFVVDYLSSRKAQANEAIYIRLYQCGSSSLPMYSDLMSIENAVGQALPNGVKSYRWFINLKSFTQFQSVQECITNAHFRDVLSTELTKLCAEYVKIENDETAKKELISEYYRNMQRMLRE